MRVFAVKEEGTHPPAEGYLAGFAEVFSVRSLSDLEVLAESKPDLVICDVFLGAMGIDTAGLLRKLTRRGGHTPVILITAFDQSPARLKSQLSKLSALKGPSRQRLSIVQIAQLMDVSQETLGRILNVSSKTAYRWMKKGITPRRKPELEQLERAVAVLKETLPSREAIRGYLHHPNPTFAGETPITLLSRGEFDHVIGDLMALREGAFE